MESALVKRGEKAYKINKERWERLYQGKIIAIDVETGGLTAVGETLDEVCEKVVKGYPAKQFYFRRVGSCPATSYLYFFG